MAPVAYFFAEADSEVKTVQPCSGFQPWIEGAVRSGHSSTGCFITPSFSREPGVQFLRIGENSVPLATRHAMDRRLFVLLSRDWFVLIDVPEAVEASLLRTA